MAPPGRPARRSARQRKPTKKYTTDPFVGLESAIYQTSDSGSDTTVTDENDREFDEEDLVEAEQEEVVQDVPLELQSDGDRSDSSGDSDYEAYGDGDSDGDNIRRRRMKGPHVRDERASRGAQVTADHPDHMHIRGVAASRKLGRENRVIARFGPGQEDVIAHARTRDKWVNQPGLPTKAEKGERGGGLGHSFFWPLEKREREANQGWEWYYELGGQAKFKQTQDTRLVDAKEVSDLVTGPVLSKNCVLLGPTGHEKLHELHTLQTLSLEIAWSGTGKEATRRRGWVINIGRKLQCLNWVPNQEDSCQYLTLAVRNDAETPIPSAFSPRRSARSCIQIWELRDIHKTVLSMPPKLRAVLSFNWNDVRRLQWCPTPGREHVPKSNPAEVRLGLLAGIWLDGCVRILDVVLPVSDSITYIHVSKAAFEIKPPDTVCTSVTWLSSTSIAVGCANGYVGIWNLPDVLNVDPPGNMSHSATVNTRPWFYKPLHQNYVANITSGYPSRPHILFSNGADGHTRMTDLRDPRADVCNAPRNRGLFLPLVWHDHTQLAVSTGEGFQIRAHTVRQFNMSFGLTRCESLCLDFAVSPVHPILLASSDDGSVISLNLNRRTHGARINVTFSHTWFNYEWRDGFSDEARKAMNWEVQNPEDDEATSAGSILRSPLGRFNEGYRPQKVNIDEATRSAIKDGIAYSTVHEDQSAVNLICWNPSLRCGTWAAAATGSGLVRVEDLAIGTGDGS